MKAFYDHLIFSDNDKETHVNNNSILDTLKNQDEFSNIAKLLNNENENNDSALLRMSSTKVKFIK